MLLYIFEFYNITEKIIMNDIYQLIEETSEQLGFKLIECNINEKSRKIIIVIYKPSGISINDCEKLNKELQDDIEFIEKFKGKYDLEISSPGVNRILKNIKEYQIFKGKEITIIADTDEISEKIYKGILQGVDKENNILVEIEYNLHKIPYSQIKKGSLLYEKL